MNKIFLKATIITLLGMTLGGCSAGSIAESIAGGDEEGDQHSNSSLYVKDINGAAVAGVAYSCSGGYVHDDDDIVGNSEELITSGSTSNTGDVAISYWPGYDVVCDITTVDAPELYLYDANGPINNTQVYCTSGSNGFTGEDGYGGSINNAASDTCHIRGVIN